MNTTLYNTITYENAFELIAELFVTHLMLNLKEKDKISRESSPSISISLLFPSSWLTYKCHTHHHHLLFNEMSSRKWECNYTLPDDSSGTTPTRLLIKLLSFLTIRFHLNFLGTSPTLTMLKRPAGTNL